MAKIIGSGVNRVPDRRCPHCVKLLGDADGDGAQQANDFLEHGGHFDHCEGKKPIRGGMAPCFLPEPTQPERDLVVELREEISRWAEEAPTRQLMCRAAGELAALRARIDEWSRRAARFAGEAGESYRDRFGQQSPRTRATKRLRSGHGPTAGLSAQPGGC